MKSVVFVSNPSTLGVIVRPVCDVGVTMADGGRQVLLTIIIIILAAGS